jgi:hypothetical protein
MIGQRRREERRPCATSRPANQALPPLYLHRIVGALFLRPARGAEKDTRRVVLSCLARYGTILRPPYCTALSPSQLYYPLKEIRHLYQFLLLSVSLCPLYCTRTYRRQLHAYFLIRPIHDLNISTWWHFPLRLLEEKIFR